MCGVGPKPIPLYICKKSYPEVPLAAVRTPALRDPYTGSTSLFTLTSRAQRDYFLVAEREAPTHCSVSLGNSLVLLSIITIVL